MASVDGLTAPFFNNPQYSDIIIKYGEHQIRAHKVILAQHSGYFATAFFSHFQIITSSTVASSPIIDLGDEDDSELLTDTIKYIYRHGSVLDQLQRRNRSVTMDELIDIYQLADKYDIPEIRRNVDSIFCELAYIHFSGKNASTTFESYFVNCIARVCGPNSIQLADNTIKNSILQICHEVCIRLFQKNTFRQWYREGELFDVESAATFGMGLGRRLLASNGIAAEESDGFPEIKPPTWVLPTAERRHMIDFFDDKRLYDITVTCSGQKISAHRIILATGSSYFQDVLENAPTLSEINLGREHDSVVMTAFLEDIYSTACTPPSPERSPMFFAEMYLLAQYHGRYDSACTYEANCHDALHRVMFTDEYFSFLAALCDPGSSRFADTSLPDMTLSVLPSHIEHMGDRYGMFKKKIEEGSLFDDRSMKRFALVMLDSFQMERTNGYW